MKKQEEIIISKKLANDLIWWLEHADVPFNDYGYWTSSRPPTQMEIARDSMVDELEKSLIAKKRWILEYDPLGLEPNEPDSFAEYKRNMQKAHRYMVRNAVRPHAWFSEGWDG